MRPGSALTVCAWPPLVGPSRCYWDRPASVMTIRAWVAPFSADRCPHSSRSAAFVVSVGLSSCLGWPNSSVSWSHRAFAIWYGAWSNTDLYGRLKVLVQEILSDQIAAVPALHFLLLSFRGVVWVGRNGAWVGAIEMVPLVSGHHDFTKACHKDRPVTPLIPFRLRARGCASGPHFSHSCFLSCIPFTRTWYMDIPQSSFSSLLLLLTAPERLFQHLTTSHMFHTYAFAHDYSVLRSHFDVLYPLADHHGHNYWLCPQHRLFSNKTTNLSPHNWYIHLLTYSRNARYIIYLDYMVVDLDFHTILHWYMAYGVQTAAVMRYLLSGWLISIGRLLPTNYAD